MVLLSKLTNGLLFFRKCSFPNLHRFQVCPPLRHQLRKVEPSRLGALKGRSPWNIGSYFKTIRFEGRTRKAIFAILAAIGVDCACYLALVGLRRSCEDTSCPFLRGTTLRFSSSADPVERIINFIAQLLLHAWYVVKLTVLGLLSGLGYFLGDVSNLDCDPPRCENPDCEPCERCHPDTDRRNRTRQTRDGTPRGPRTPDAGGLRPVREAVPHERRVHANECDELEKNPRPERHPDCDNPNFRPRARVRGARARDSEGSDGADGAVEHQSLSTDDWTFPSIDFLQFYD
ncbi:unnamed protein product, partial [Nesidiocoris tenuis]